jgi:hypothetical protein
MRFGKSRASDCLQSSFCVRFTSVRAGSFSFGKDRSQGVPPGLEHTRIETVSPDPLQGDISMLIE